MSSQLSQQATAERVVRMPVGTINIAGPHLLNWLFITWNTMKGLVRPDERGLGDGGLPLYRRHYCRARRDRGR